MNYFFLHPSSGKLMYLPEVPKEPKYCATQFYCFLSSPCECMTQKFMYEQALKEAKEKSVEVKNVFEASLFLWDAFYKNTGSVTTGKEFIDQLKPDVIYSLDDSYKVEIEQDMYAYAYDPYNTKFVAIVSVVNQKIKYENRNTR